MDGSGETDLLTRQIIGFAFRVHSALGPGFNEGVYQNALKGIFEQVKLPFEIEKSYEIVFEGKPVGKLRVDLVVDSEVIVEVKSVVGGMPKVFESQVLSYLKVSGCRVGLILNFGNDRCQVKRFVN
jgi:GxxExxY protein